MITAKDFLDAFLVLMGLLSDDDSWKVAGLFVSYRY